MTPGDSSTPALSRAVDEAGQDLREVLQAFSRTASSAFNLPAGLAVLCRSTADTFGASRVSAWLHDRRSRELVLSASSDPSGAAEGTRIRSDSELLPAIALTRHRPVRLDPAAGGSKTVIALPLRGRRRALGVLVFEGLGPEVEPRLVVELEDLGRQLSASIENLLLLEDVLRARRELAQTFDSLEDLIAICDARLRVVHVNRTLSDRVAHPRDRIFDRPLQEVVGEEAGEWLASIQIAEGAHDPATYAKELDDEVLGGRFTMTVTPIPGADLGGYGAVFVARDITRQARLESERAELQHRLAQAEKQAAVRELVKRIARDLKSPLEAIADRAGSLAGRTNRPAAMRKDVAALTSEAGRALRMVEDLLVLAGGRRSPKKA